MRFVVIDLLTGFVTAVVDIDVVVYQHLVASRNPKVAALRELFTDPRPTPGQNQRVIVGPIVVELTRARETWVVIDKTQDEIAAEQEAANRADEYQALRGLIDALRNGVGTAGERMTRVERVSVRLLLDAVATLVTRASKRS